MFLWSKTRVVTTNRTKSTSVCLICIVRPAQCSQCTPLCFTHKLSRVQFSILSWSKQLKQRYCHRIKHTSRFKRKKHFGVDQAHTKMHSVVNCWPISATREGWHHPQSLDQVLLLRAWIIFQTQKYFPDQNRQQRPFVTLLLPVLSSVHRLTLSWSTNTPKTLSALSRKHLSAEPQLGLMMEQGWWALRPLRYMSSVILLCSESCPPPSIGFSKGTESTGRPYLHQDYLIQTLTVTFCWRRCCTALGSAGALPKAIFMGTWSVTLVTERPQSSTSSGLCPTLCQILTKFHSTMGAHYHELLLDAEGFFLLP